MFCSTHLTVVESHANPGQKYVQSVDVATVVGDWCSVNNDQQNLGNVSEVGVSIEASRIVGVQVTQLMAVR